MTEAEKMAKTLGECSLCLDGEWRDEIADETAALIRSQEAKIKRMAEALRDYHEGWDKRDILAERHAEALRDAGIAP